MLVINLSLGSELVPSHSAKIPFDHVILEFWKTDKVFTFAVDYMLSVYAYVYAHIKILASKRSLQGPLSLKKNFLAETLIMGSNMRNFRGQEIMLSLPNK